MVELPPNELNLLLKIQEDGWPLAVLAPNDPRELEDLQSLALSLIRRGLASVYGPSDDLLPQAGAEAVLSETSNWRDNAMWFIATTEEGAAAAQSG